MGKKLALFSLLICSPALASLVPLVPSSHDEVSAAVDRSDWIASHLGPLGLTFSSQPRFVVPPDSKSGTLLEELTTPDSPPSFQAGAPSKEPALSGETAPPGKLALLIIILVGALIRFLTSATFRDFLTDAFSTLAPY